MLCLFGVLLSSTQLKHKNYLKVYIIYSQYIITWLLSECLCYVRTKITFYHISYILNGEHVSKGNIKRGYQLIDSSKIQKSWRTRVEAPGWCMIEKTKISTSYFILISTVACRMLLDISRFLVFIAFYYLKFFFELATNLYIVISTGRETAAL